MEIHRPLFLLLMVVACLEHSYADSSAKNPIQCTIDQDMPCLNLFKGRPEYINFRGPFGRTPLHYAAIGQNRAIVQLLIEMGAKTEVQDEYDNTPLISSLHVVRSRNPDIKVEIVGMICEKTNADFRNHLNKGAADVLYYAIRYYSPEIVRVLLECGVKITAFHSQYALKWLAERRPSPLARDPIARQALAECEEIEKILRAKGLVSK